MHFEGEYDLKFSENMERTAGFDSRGCGDITSRIGRALRGGSQG